MRLATLSQNVQGLNNPSEVHVLQNYFQSHLSKTDTICFQETKLRCTNLQDVSKIMWHGAIFYGVEAKVAYNHTTLDKEARSGGLCTWVSLRLSHLIKETGQDRGGHTQWFGLTKVRGEDVGVLNIYAPHSSRERCMLWKELLAYLPRDFR